MTNAAAIAKSSHRAMDRGAAGVALFLCPFGQRSRREQAHPEGSSRTRALHSTTRYRLWFLGSCPRAAFRAHRFERLVVSSERALQPRRRQPRLEIVRRAGVCSFGWRCDSTMEGDPSDLFDSGSGRRAAALQLTPLPSTFDFDEQRTQATRLFLIDPVEGRPFLTSRDSAARASR